MKTQSYNPGPAGIIKVIGALFFLQMSVISFASLAVDQPENQTLPCVTCDKDLMASQGGTFLNDLISLSPVAPDEATFTEVIIYNEIDLAPATPVEASFDDDPQLIDLSVLAFLAPAAPLEADFTD